MRDLGNTSVQFSCTFTLVKIMGGTRHGGRKRKKKLLMIFKKFKVTIRRIYNEK